MDPPSTDKATKNERPRHNWTDFEGTVLMNLIIRNVHKTGLEKDELSKLSDSTAPRTKHRNARRAKEVADPERFKYVDVATALNRALHKSDYTHDIPVEEVEKLLHFFLRDRKGAIATIERLPTARLTRSSHRIWNRGLKFLGTKTEWENGRKAAEEVKRREDQERRLNVGNAGAITAGANATGVADGWGNDTAAAPLGDGWGTAANKKNTDSPAPVGVWGDAMEVDTPAKAANNPKANDEGSTVEASSGAWGSGTADSSTAVVTNAADPWGAGAESTAKSNSSTAAWGEPETTEAVAATVIAAAADWSAHEDPFATPLPPSLHSSTNKTTAPFNDWNAPSASSATNVPEMVASDPWNESSAGRTDPVSDATENVWGTITRTSMNALPPTATGGRKLTDAAAAPWGTSAESTPASLHGTPDTAVDPWGSSAASSVIQPSAMDWGAEASNVAPANSSVTKTLQQAGPPETPADKSAPMSFANSWGQPATAAADSWGEPVADTTLQAITTTASEWGGNIEKPQGHMGNSQTAATAELRHSEDARTTNQNGTAQSSTLNPVPPGWGPEPMILKKPMGGMGNTCLWLRVEEEIPDMDYSTGFQNANRRSSNTDKAPSNLIQSVQAAGPGINPDRLAMMAAAETDDDGVYNFEMTANEGTDGGRKSFKPSAIFGSHNNAIPLKFNRLAGK